jgi:hypothetical protein
MGKLNYGPPEPPPEYARRKIPNAPKWRPAAESPDIAPTPEQIHVPKQGDFDHGKASGDRNTRGNK